MNRIDWKFAVLVTVFALFWLMTIRPNSIDEIMPYSAGSGVGDSIRGLISSNFRMIPDLLTLTIITAATLTAFAYFLSEIWNRFLRAFFPKLLDIRTAEVYVLLIIIPILTGYLF